MQMHESATLKAGHGLANGYVEIEQQKVHDVMVPNTVGEIAQYSGAQQANGQSRSGMLESPTNGERRQQSKRQSGKPMKMPFFWLKELKAAPVLPQ